MAGTKLAYRNVNDASSYQPLMRNMDENDVLSRLENTSFDQRAQGLEQLRQAARRNGGKLPFQDQRAIFQHLNTALADSNWDVRHQCIQLLHELIPSFGDDLDDCMSIVLEHLIPNIGDSKITVRRAVIQTIHVYMKYTADIQKLFRSIVRFGLENRNSRIKKEMVISLPMVFTPEFSQENMYEITQALAKCLLDSDSDQGNGLKNHALLSLQKIKKLVGDGIFNAYLQKLSAPLRRYYHECMENQEEFTDNNNKPDSRQSGYSVSSSRSNGHIKAFEAYQEPPQPEPRSKQTMLHSTSDLEFGIVPGHIMDKLNDQSNFRARAQGVEELKLIIKDLEDINVLHPHVLNFISFLNNLLDDSNFKITTVTLEILGLLVTKLSFNVQPHLKPLVLALCKRMGDNKIVVRQAIMKVAIQLMQILSPKDVLTVICDNLAHRNSRVRQETLNIVIRSLLTFPSYEFDLGELCQKIAHTLVDPKRQVRQASLECFSVLAQAMGAGKLQPLVQAVDSVELSYDGDGVMAAVQSRLARRQLPRVNADGLIDYATPIPSSAASSRGSAPVGADIDWILMASGGAGSSARSARSDIELESIASGSARSTPVHIPESPVHTPRGSGRHLASASRRNKLPWDDESDPNRSPQYSAGSSSDAPVPCLRVQELKQPKRKKFIAPKKREISYVERYRKKKTNETTTTYVPNRSYGKKEPRRTDEKTNLLNEFDINLNKSDTEESSKTILNVAAENSSQCSITNVHETSNDIEEEFQRRVSRLAMLKAENETLRKDNNEIDEAICIEVNIRAEIMEERRKNGIEKAKLKNFDYLYDKKVRPPTPHRPFPAKSKYDDTSPRPDLPPDNESGLYSMDRSPRDPGRVDHVDEEPSTSAQVTLVSDRYHKEVTGTAGCDNTYLHPHHISPSQADPDPRAGLSVFTDNKSPSPAPLKRSSPRMEIEQVDTSRCPELKSNRCSPKLDNQNAINSNSLHVKWESPVCFDLTEGEPYEPLETNDCNNTDIPFNSDKSLSPRQLEMDTLAIKTPESISPTSPGSSPLRPKTGKLTPVSPARSPHMMFNCRKSPGFKINKSPLPSPEPITEGSRSPETRSRAKRLRLSDVDHDVPCSKITPDVPDRLSPRSPGRSPGNPAVTGTTPPPAPGQEDGATSPSIIRSSPTKKPAGINVIGKSKTLPPLPPSNKPVIHVEFINDPDEEGTFGSEKKSSRRRNRRDDTSPESTYREKYQSSKSDRGGQPFSVYTPKGEDGRSHSTPSSGTTTPRYDYHDDISYNKRILNPIGASESAVSWDDPTGPVDSAPIPTKPINMASRSTSSKRKVPPIAARQDSYEYIDSARESIYDDEDSRDDMPDPQAMHKIRNSATKKKVNKMFSEMARTEQDDVDSGFYSKQTSRDESEYSKEPTHSSKKNNADNPFGKKPKRVARSMSGQSPKSETPPSSGSSDVDYLHFQPIGGVSFRENKNSDVAIVGKGYSDENVKVPYSQAQKPKDRRKPANKAALSPLGVANLYSHGQLDDEDEKLDVLVGKGMFEGSSTSSDHHIGGTGQLVRPDRRPSQTDGPNPNDFPRGVYGISMKKDPFDEEEDENAANISMSRSTREQIQKKMQARKEEEAKKREEEERLEREAQERREREERQERLRQEKAREAREAKEEAEREKKEKEKERQQERLRKLSANDNRIVDGALTIAAQTNTSPPQPAARKKPPPRRNTKPAEESPPTSHKSVESEDESKPYKDPHKALDESLKSIQKEDWELKMSSISSIRRLIQHHPDVVSTQLHPVTIAILNEIKNLRSQVSRLAIVCLGEMYLNLKKAMDTDLDQTTRTLLAKAGESNGFIREDVDKSLHLMVDNTTANRAAVALIAGGATHRNTAVRKTAAHFLSILVERMGPGRVLSGVKDVTDKILPTAAQFLLDGAPDTRYSGQKIMYSLMSHEDFDRQLTKHVPANVLRNVQDKLDALKRKGLGDPPNSTTSATRRSGGPRSGSQSRHNSAADSKNNSATKRRSAAPRLDDATMEEIKSMASSMSANDWRERQKGIVRLQDMCQTNPNLVNNNIVKIFDQYIPTLKDSNSKVNLFSLQVLNQITPTIKDNISNLVTLILTNVASNLSSKNRDIHEAATDVLDAFMEYVEPVLLLQPLCNIAQTANSRIKPDMVERISYLVTQVYPQKPKQVKMFALPLLWHLLSTANGSGATQGASGSSRQATSNLVQSLYSQMGPGLMEQAQATSSVSPRMVQQLQDLIEHP